MSHSELVQVIEEYLQVHLSERTYGHCLRVRDAAMKMADRFGVDREKAELAGLLHDCAKVDTVLLLAETLQVELDDYTRGNRELAHAAVGAELAKSTFGIEDEEILNAILYHTTGRERMTKLEKIIYVADCMEPARNFEGVEEIRRLAEEDLDGAVLEAIGSTLAYILNRKKVIHPKSLYTYNYLAAQGMQE